MSKQPKSNVPKKKDTKISSADDLIKAGKSGDIELDEEELKRVSGGHATGPVQPVKIVIR